MLRRKKSKKSIWKGLLFVFYILIIAFPAAAQDFTVVVLPDTQHYSQSYPAIFLNQTQWIVNNKDALNIVYVVHEGDIVETASSTEQWNSAVNAMNLLENPVTNGLPDGIPYGVVPGNHDEPTTNYNTYFGVSRFSNRDYYGGSYLPDINDSNYTFFSASGMDFIVIDLEYTSPPTDLLEWADSLLKTYSYRRAIVVTHYILDTDGSFGPWGQQVYNALKDNPNLFLMLCGHQHGEAMRREVYNGNTINIMLANYQDLPNGGNGWLRIMEFSPENDEITVTTYSPSLNQYGADTAMGEDTTSEVFTISYNMNVVANPAGDAIVASDSGGGGGCFIATAAYGSMMEPQVKILRDFRDRFLLHNSAGKGFIGLYYAYSLKMTDFISKHDNLRAIVRISLLPVVGFSWIALKLGAVSAIALMIFLISCLGGLVWFRRKKNE